MDPYNNNDNINISDVIEVINTNDPGFIEETRNQEQQNLNLLSGGGMESVNQAPAVQQPATNNPRINAYAEIVEQPASKALRFRYKCEGRSAGSIPGVNSTTENKAFPSIRIVGYRGPAVVVVSCVTKDEPYRPHPHNLVGKEGCKRGVCTVEVTSDNMTVTFANLGIQCVKKNDIEDALKEREQIRVDPYRTGFDHKRQPTSIDLNAVRLCFQVFLKPQERGRSMVLLKPIVSDPIYDKKAMSDLVICKLSHCSASVAGGTEMVLLCEKIAKEDIQVRFFEEMDGRLVWEGYGDFQPSQVHKQVAIAFRTPSYHSQQIDQPVQCYIQLKRPSDGETSEALPFQMLPLGADDPDSLKRKRQKFNNNPTSLVLRHMQAEGEKRQRETMNQPPAYNFNLVKPEPIDNMMGYGGMQASGSSPMYSVPSPLSPPNFQSFRSSPGRTPSPMDIPNTLGPMPPQALTPQYSTSPGHVSPSLQPQLMYNNQPLVMNRLTPDPPEMQQFQAPLNTLPMDTNGPTMLDLDNHQYSFDMNQLGINPFNSAELQQLVQADLSDNFSAGLSLSDPPPVPEAPGVVEVPPNMTDSLTRVTRDTIQELCSLNNLYRPPEDVE